MRAYIAIIKDSFREAMASHVLWVLLAVITLVLAAISPFGFQEEAASILRQDEIVDVGSLCRRIKDQGESASLSPGRRIWTFLSDDLKDQFSQATPSNPMGLIHVGARLRYELNELIKRRDFFAASDWKDIELNPEALTLIEQGVENLSDEQLARMNRLLLEAAYPEQIAASPETVVVASYFGFKVLRNLPIKADQIRTVLQKAILVFMTVFAGVIGVFVAILVTASTVPQTFETGAIDLLLSKPVSRWLLFLSKFVGGCAFIFLNVTYLIVGLWLVAGLRHGIWSGRLLLCIPIFLFLFAIYYSISALAGVLWKSAVLSVVMTILFWLTCTIVDVAKSTTEMFYVNGSRLEVLVPAGKSLIATNNGGEAFEWNEEQNEWEAVFESTEAGARNFAMGYPLLGPVYDAQKDRIVAIESFSMPSRFSMLSATGRVLTGKRDEKWIRNKGATAPSDVNNLFIDGKGRILVAGPSGVRRFEGDASVGHKPFKLFGFDIAPKNLGGKFIDVTPKDIEPWKAPFAAARNPVDGSLAVFVKGKLLFLNEQPEGLFLLDHRMDLETDQPAVLGYSGETAVVAFGDGEIRVLRAGESPSEQKFQPFHRRKPRSVVASNDGRWFAVLFHHHRLWLYDAVKQQPLEIDVAGQGDISAVAFSAENHMLVADRIRRVIEYQLDPFRVVQSRTPSSEFLELAYRYALVPIYTIFPKPGELDNLVRYLLTEEKSVSVSGDEQRLESTHIALEIWEPVVSNLAFLAVVLGLTCIYISRKDF